MWRLVLHGLLRRRGQTAATALGVALGVALLLAVFLLFAGLDAGLKRSRRGLGADLLVIPAGAAGGSAEEALFTGAPLNIYLDKKYAEAARRVPGVRRVDGQFFTQSLEMECCSTGTSIRLVGVEPETIRDLGPETVAVQGLQSDEILMGARTLGGLGGRGTKVELMGDIYRSAGQIEATGTGLDDSILLPIAEARQLASAAKPLRAVWTRYGPPDQLLSALLVEIDPGANVDEVADALEALGPLRVIRTSLALQHARQMIGAFVIVLAGAGLLAALASIAHLFSQFASAAWDRKGEWALYRALGASRAKLVGLVTGEALSISLGGAVIGIPLGLSFYHLALTQLSTSCAFPFVPPSSWLFADAAAIALLAYALVGITAAWGPAWRIAHLEPASTLARGDVD